MRAPRALVADVVPFSWVDGPGNRFVLFLQGCTFDCLACHNPHTITEQSVHASTVTVDDVLDRIRASMPYVSGVTVSGGEATFQAPFVLALFTAMAADATFAGLTRLIDSNGDAEPSVWDALAPVTDGVMVDLKALDPDLHIELTGRPNDRVLASIVHLAAIGRLHEVRLLLVPGRNDTPEQVRATAAWLLAVDPHLRIRLNAFSTHGVRSPASGWRAATRDDIEAWRELLHEAGVTNVA